MNSQLPLLIVQQGKKGTFVSWLEDLGLKEFISRYPLPKLVEWEWLVPQYRIVFPNDYFLTWQNYPEYPVHLSPERPCFDIENALWDSTWHLDDDQKPLWFLHPFFHSDNDYGNKLRNANVAPTHIPDEFIHPYRSELISPYADYYFHWQAYALIDVIRTADRFMPIINTPDVEEQVQNLLCSAARAKVYTTKPSDVIKQPHSWGGLSESMTWLSHYCAFRDALPYDCDPNLRNKGAKQLAEYLKINAEILEKFIEKLLNLASIWLGENERYCVWTIKAWPYLQKDIMWAMEWLVCLSDKKFSYYLDKWKWKDFQRHEWAELHKVLPYEFFEDKQHFLRYAPIYNNKQYKGMLPIDENLNQLVSSLQAKNYPFDSFLYAFRQLHENLNHKPKHKGGLNFRVSRPLDYFLLLAIRTEVCLRYALEKDGTLGEKTGGLETYILALAKQRNISNYVIDAFKERSKKLTQLRDTPEDPIGKIMAISNDKWSIEETHLVQAFLCCVLARNYFAHHTYLDNNFIPDEKSAFMLAGIIVTLLYLLDS